MFGITWEGLLKTAGVVVVLVLMAVFMVTMLLGDVISLFTSKTRLFIADKDMALLYGHYYIHLVPAGKGMDYYLHCPDCKTCLEEARNGKQPSGVSHIPGSSVAPDAGGGAARK